VNLHTGYEQLPEVVKWITTQSRFKNLDWRNLGQVDDEWAFYSGVPGVTQDFWSNRILFDNANWHRQKDDKFTVDVLDAGGVVRASAEYFRSEFIASSPNVGHSRFGWHVERVLPPAYPGDTTVRPLPVIPGYPPEPPIFRTVARLDLFGSTNPFKTIRIPDLRGDGAIRVRWSQLPEGDEFYFPVTFITQQDQPLNCTDGAGNPVQCGFGLDPNLRFVAPGPEGFYKPGETVNMFVDLRDDQGNRLHPKDTLPSGAEITNSQANGLLAMIIPYFENTTEADMVPSVTMIGPLHKARTRSNPYDKAPYFADPAPYEFVSATATTTLTTAEYGQKWGTRISRNLPPDAEAGTYVALVKWNRFFNGERVAKAKPHFFQVGTTERTSYPGRVGNCQICHRGVLSLDNLRHGLSVDHIEGCKSCHQYETERGLRPQLFIHRIHMRSPRYPAARNDCTMCHLTRESATRPSLDVCSTCHNSAHGDQFFASRFRTHVEPNRFGNCAQSCHGDTPPRLHILPEN
jgi:hypothetical protein